MTRPADMKTADLRDLLETTDSHIRDLDHRMATTPTDTAAYAAMTESRPELIRFRRGLDDALASRGA